MISTPNILIIDDDEDDSVLVRDLLSDAFPQAARADWAETYESGLAAMEAGGHDAYIVDYRLGRRDGLDLVRAAVERGCDSPIIFVTGQDCRQTDLDAMAAGAVDYLVKGEITASILERSIRYAIERKRVEQRLERLGFEDDLTGLSSRTLFHNRLEQTIKLARRENHVFAVAMMDLDGFKAINDIHGHAAGDVVLVEIARRAKAVLRASDTIARIGGDEFAAVLPTASSAEGALVVAGRLVDIARRPISLERCEVRVGLSVGIAFFPADGEEPGEVLERADQAMYEAKRTKSGFVIAGDGDRANSVSGAILAGRLATAIDCDELDMHHQPKIDLRTGAVWGVEALVRWHHPERGLLTPADFVEAVEKTAAIEPMTIATLSKALEHAAAFRAAGHDLCLAVNLSARALRIESLPELITKALAEFGLPAQSLTLEVSEPGLAEDFDRSVAMLSRITATGVSLAIDDFGAGLGVFGRLKALPISEIKMHESLIGDLSDDADLAVVRSIISLCDGLGLAAVAEAAETTAKLDRLTALGCHMAQGFVIAPPMPAGQVCNWVDGWSMPKSPRRAASR